MRLAKTAGPGHLPFASKRRRNSVVAGFRWRGLMEFLLPAAIVLILIEAGILPGVARSDPGDIIIERWVPPRVAERTPLSPSPDVVSVNPSPNGVIQGILNGNSQAAPVQRELGDGEIATIVTGAVGPGRSGPAQGNPLAGSLNGNNNGIGQLNGAVLPSTGGGSPVGNVGGTVNSAINDAMRGAGLMR